MSFYSHFQKYSLPILENGVKLPDFKIEEKYKEKYNLQFDCSDYDFLSMLCNKGLETKVGENNPKYKEYQKRTKQELSVFKDLGFCSYILITWDIVNYCIENNIATGFGRGSAGNCLVLYLTNVTEIDPISSGDLYFERFLNKTRAKFKEIDNVKYYDGSLLCDVDLDISFSDRKRLIDWLNEKYKGKIAKLPTTGTYTTKVLLKEVSKAYLEVDEENAKIVSSMIPEEYGKPKKIEEAYVMSEDFKKFADENPELIKISKRLYELNKYNGIHASAWVITADDINDIFPLKLSKEGELCSVYTMEDSLNLAIKVDILGLRCATLIDRICKRVKINPLKIPVDDEKIYEFLQNLQCPKGLFQIEADTNFRVLKQVKPKKLAHLAAIVALARPGVLQFAEVFAKYVETGEFQSVHPFFDDILKDTAGIPLYQESLLKMANKVGFTLSESETLRRIIGKKKTEEMATWQEKVKNKVTQNNLPPEVGDILWKIMDDSKNYSFNAGHASAYGLMSYVTAYLKHYHTQQFYLALLELSKDEQNTTQEIQIIQSEMKNFGMKLLGPDLMKSGIDFAIDGENIRFGLGYIKGIAQKSFEKLQNFKHEYPNKFQIFLSAEECGINIGVLSSLIMSGAMDDYITESRSKSVFECQSWRVLTPREKEKCLEFAKDYDYKLFAVTDHLKTLKNEKGVPFFKESRLVTIRKNIYKYKEIYNKNKDYEDLTAYYYEKKLLGYSYSHRLPDILRKSYPDIIPIDEIKNLVDGENAMVCGEIEEVTYFTSRNKNKCCKLKINDGNSFEFMITNKKWDNKEIDNIGKMEDKNGGKFEENWIVVTEGNKSRDSFFCKQVIRQDINIYSKLSEIKDQKKLDKEGNKE
jgi:DNA polymerase III subunit alpha